MKTKVKLLYRYSFYSTYWGVALNLNTFRVIKETPCGFWIEPKFCEKRWVKKNAKASYANETKEEAFQYFIARTKRRIEILRYQLKNCEASLNLTPQSPEVSVNEMLDFIKT